MSSHRRYEVIGTKFGGETDTSTSLGKLSYVDVGRLSELQVRMRYLPISRMVHSFAYAYLKMHCWRRKSRRTSFQFQHFSQAIGAERRRCGRQVEPSFMRLSASTG